MEGFNKLNIQQICSVKSWLKTKFSVSPFPKHEILYNKNLYVEGEEVFYKPHIEIRMSNQTVHLKFFNTEKELFDFMEQPEIKNVNWINN